MKKAVQSIVGISMSKDSLDVAMGLNIRGAKITKKRFSNTLEGYKNFERFLEKQGFLFNETLFCIENSGISYHLLLDFLSSKKAITWIETALRIKESIGLQIGKSKRMVCERIFMYAVRNQNEGLLYYWSADKEHIYAKTKTKKTFSLSTFLHNLVEKILYNFNLKLTKIA